MPTLNTNLHLNMLKSHEPGLGLYGLEWGDPEIIPPLKYIKEKFVLPFVKNNEVALEIGPGGGRWTRYITDFKKLYLVDYHQELLDELRKRFNEPNMVFVKNNGDDFPNVPENSVDYIFSFGTFVHLDFNIIEKYMQNFKKIIKPSTNIVIQYSDKTKVMAQDNKDFSENYPLKMRQLVKKEGYKIINEDTTSLWHSSIIHFKLG